MTAQDFFANRRVFTTEEFGAALGLSRRSRDSLLAYHRKRGRLLPARRGLYWVVPAGQTPETCSPDPFLLACRMADDAVLAYHTALEFHGRAYSDFKQMQYQTAHAVRAVSFRDWYFRPVHFPKPLMEQGKALFGVESLERAGEPVRVVSLERALVDVLDRPDLGGGWEELWRSLEMVEFFDLDRVVDYALLLGKATTVGKVGWFLQAHRKPLMVEKKHLQALRGHRPRQPHYITRGQGGTTHFVADWNLVVPEALAERGWDEVT